MGHQEDVFLVRNFLIKQRVDSPLRLCPALSFGKSEVPVSILKPLPGLRKFPLDIFSRQALNDAVINFVEPGINNGGYLLLVVLKADCLPGPAGFADIDLVDRFSREEWEQRF